MDGGSLCGSSRGTRDSPHESEGGDKKSWINGYSPHSIEVLQYDETPKHAREIVDIILNVKF